MDFTKAIQRIVWRFENFDHIIVNENDIEAANAIIEYLNRVQDREIQDNIHFAKLYTFVLGYFLRKYNTSIDNDIPHEELHRLLDRPFKNILDDLKDQINFKHKLDILEQAGCQLNGHPSQLTGEERRDNVSKVLKILEQSQKSETFIPDSWNSEQIELGIKEQINNFLNGTKKDKKRTKGRRHRKYNLPYSRRLLERKISN